MHLPGMFELLEISANIPLLIVSFMLVCWIPEPSFQGVCKSVPAQLCRIFSFTCFKTLHPERAVHLMAWHWGKKYMTPYILIVSTRLIRVTRHIYAWEWRGCPIRIIHPAQIILQNMLFWRRCTRLPCFQRLNFQHITMTFPTNIRFLSEM